MDTDEKVKQLAQWYYDRLHQDTRVSGEKFYKFCARVSPDADLDEPEAEAVQS